MKKHLKARGFLFKQKPKSRRKKKVVFIIKLFAVAAFLSGAIFGTYKVYHSAIKNYRLSKNIINWKVNIISSDNLTPSQKALLIKEIKSLKDDSYNSLLQKANKIQGQLLAKKITLFHSKKNIISAIVSLRKPVLKIQADKIRLLTDDLEVYGQADNSYSKLAIITGIFDVNKKFKTSPTKTIELSSKEKTLIKEALELYKLTKNTYEIKEIKNIKYRGFSLIIKKNNKDIEIIIGRSPFDLNLKKLTKIFIDIKKRGSQALKIELDYKGKAFIKEQNM